MEIEKFKPCREGLKFRAQFKSFEEAWDRCPRGDQMLKLASQLGVNKRKLTLAKALCVETVLHLMDDERSRAAVEVAKRYGLGEATEEELRTAARAAAAADARATARGARAADAAHAAAAAADAAYADAAYAARAAADAAYAAAAYAAARAARRENRSKTADICREILTEDVLMLIEKQ